MSRLERFVALAAIGLCLTTGVRAQGAPGPIVDAPAGAAVGKTENGVRIFEGLPYAAPPVGSARWTPPKPLSRWSGVRDATQFGPACIQPLSQLGSIYADDPTSMSEDCLSLNIWTPTIARAAPVMVWIHGGALVSGASSEAIYDGARLAKKGVIVVSINYRLGVFGYLAHPELSAESAQKISGNYGLLDQIEALRWIKANISAFGGDPQKVAIAGESAGGLSVMYLMASPQARGLFSKAIAESAYMISTPQLHERKFGAPSAEESGLRLAAALHAPDVATLRAIDAKTLSKASVVAGFAPFGVVDGQVLPRQLVDVFDRGEQAPVPILAGFNSGEIRSLRVLAPPAPALASTYETSIRDRYGDLADAYLKLYPASSVQESILASTRDALYGWTAERLVKKQAAIGQPSFLYLFDHGFPAADSIGLHAFHASEVPFVFGTLDRTPPNWPKVAPIGAQAKLSQEMLSYWSSFVSIGKPLGLDGPAWPSYGPSGGAMVFQAAPRAYADVFPGMYDLNETVVCRRRASGDLAWNWNVGIIAPVLPRQQAPCR